MVVCVSGPVAVVVVAVFPVDVVVPAAVVDAAVDGVEVSVTGGVVLDVILIRVD